MEEEFCRSTGTHTQSVLGGSEVTAGEIGLLGDFGAGIQVVKPLL